jgi:hypothetical protein
MKFLLKLPFKILAVPFVIGLSVLGAAMRFLRFISGSILAMASVIIALGGIYFLLCGEIYTGVGSLVIAFLVSPFGIPAIAELLTALVDGVNDAVKGFIVG